MLKNATREAMEVSTNINLAYHPCDLIITIEAQSRWNDKPIILSLHT